MDVRVARSESSPLPPRGAAHRESARSRQLRPAPASAYCQRKTLPTSLSTFGDPSQRSESGLPPNPSFQLPCWPPIAGPDRPPLIGVHLLRRNLIPVSAHMTNVIGFVQLNLEAIRIVELERFFRIATLELQIELLQLRARLVSVEARDSEVIMIDAGSLTIALLDAEEGVSHTQDVCICRLLLKRHREELLIEL